MRFEDGRPSLMQGSRRVGFITAGFSALLHRPQVGPSVVEKDHCYFLELLQILANLRRLTIVDTFVLYGTVAGSCKLGLLFEFVTVNK